jgi:hypothetical protein
MTKLGDALREKFRGDPKAVLLALGLDQSLLKENRMTAKPTRLANVALQLTAAAIKPFLAKDAKINLMPIFAGVTTKNFKPKEIKIALDAALKGKLAKDAEPHMGHIGQLLDHIGEATDPKTADETVTEEQRKAMEAAALGNGGALGMPERATSYDAGMENLKGYLKDKGMDEDTIKGACDALGLPKNALDESPEEKEAREKEEKEKKAAADADVEEAKKKEADEKAAKEAEMKDMVKKPAMDAAIASAVAATTKSIRETERGIRTALNEVKPWVGELPATIAFDSATEVYRHAAGMIPSIAASAKTLHADALLPVIQAQPKPGARPTIVRDESSMGMDSAGKSFAERHPEAARIQNV